ncbi:MAG: ribose-5-phosphate isomerase RpiA [Thermoproteota archaeon]|nr:ribose-5-phosphate isomerase RpiA [Candidatus Brockarchaeota archaeon]
MSNDIEMAKVLAAKEALKYIEESKIIGIGTGSTVGVLLKEIKERGFRDKVFVPSSLETALVLSSYCLNVANTISVKKIEIYLDSADEVDQNMNMIKGGGAALTTEKVLAYFSKKKVFLVDYSKLVRRLGERQPLPIEVIPQFTSMVLEELQERGYKATVRTASKAKYGLIISDLGGAIIDVTLPEGKELTEVEKELKSIPGIIETGLFLNMVDILIVGWKNKVEVLKR